MNAVEREMVEVLLDLKDNYYVEGIKAEFEAEGTRLEEAMRLKDVLSAAGLGLTLKLGGCEAVRDMYEARVLGVSRIVAPMIESPFALKKFLNAASLAFSEDEREHVKFAVNIETQTAVNVIDEIFALPEIKELDGVVIGRTDLCLSKGMSKDEINSDIIFGITRGILAKAKELGLETAVGGGVSAHSLPFFRNLPEGYLDRYETRKVIYTCPHAFGDQAEQAILKGLYFELLWLKNKRDFYGMIHNEDVARIRVLESRYKNRMENCGILERCSDVWQVKSPT